MWHGFPACLGLQQTCLRSPAWLPRAFGFAAPFLGSSLSPAEGTPSPWAPGSFLSHLHPRAGPATKRGTLPSSPMQLTLKNALLTAQWHSIGVSLTHISPATLWISARIQRLVGAGGNPWLTSSGP